MRYKRSYFFDAPQNSSGQRFRTQNIPTEEVYDKLFGSVAFVAEGDDMASSSQQGLVKVYTDENVINNRNNAAVNKGNQYVLKPHQAPSVGVPVTGTYTESTPVDESTPGAPVTGSGIKITGVIHSFGGGKRIGYQLEFDIASIATAVTANPGIGTLVPILLPGGSQGVALYSDGSNPPASALSYTHSQDVAAATWSVNHALGWRPNINIEIGGEIIETEWVHIDENNLEVRFTSAQTGKVYCS